MSGQLGINSATEQQAQLINMVKDLGHQAIVARQYLKKGREMTAAECKLWPYREVCKTGIINLVAQQGFPATPMSTGIERETKDAIEIIGNTCADTARV